MTASPIAIPADGDVANAPDAESSGQSGTTQVVSRPMIAVRMLAAHPGNVRQDLRPDPEFLASIAESGVLVPLRITEPTAAATSSSTGTAASPQPSGRARPRSRTTLLPTAPVIRRPSTWTW
jgi:hypothetical protein